MSQASLGTQNRLLRKAWPGLLQACDCRTGADVDRRNRKGGNCDERDLYVTVETNALTDAGRLGPSAHALVEIDARHRPTPLRQAKSHAATDEPKPNDISAPTACAATG